jgi:predicted GH43/DUF377 family glycosyl hydrolase
LEEFFALTVYSLYSIFRFLRWIQQTNKQQKKMFLVFTLFATATAVTYNVQVTQRDTSPILSYIDKTSAYQQIFNPTWVEPTPLSNGRKGLLARTQNCESPVGAECTFCGGSQDKASVLTYAEEKADGTWSFVDSNSIVFGPSDSTDSWGTEDPRMKFNHYDNLYYMFYTAYNGSAIYLNLATSTNPTATDTWKKLGPVFPTMQNSKSAALLLGESANGPHYLLWGDHDIRITKSADPTVWSDIGDILISPRDSNFDSKLVEAGPPPLKLSTGDYLFFYNSAENGWPDDLNTAYHVGYLILDGKDPSIIKQRSDTPLMGPVYSWEQGNDFFVLVVLFLLDVVFFRCFSLFMQCTKCCFLRSSSSSY